MADHPIKIVLMHTSDIHSVFRSMPRIAGLAEELRSQHGPAPVLLIDSGDHMDRMSPLTEGTSGRANIGILKATGYEIVTIGNNEGLTFDQAQLAELYTSVSDIKVLVSNLVERSSGRAPSWIQTSCVLEREGVRLGFIGATAPYSIFYNLLGWKVEDPIQAIRREVLRLREQTDAIILLSHLGLAVDKQLAESIEGLDIILGGHTHHVLEQPLRQGSSYLFGCGVAGEYAGEVELYFNRGTNTLKQVSGKLHRTADYPEHQEVKRLVDAYTEESGRILEALMAELKEPLAIDWNRDSPFGNLLAAGLRKWTEAEIGLINSGQILQSLLPGAVTRGMLLELCPSPVNPCLIKLKGSALRTALEQSLLPEFVTMPIYGYGFRGKRLGGLCVDGVSVVWDSEGDAHRKISEIRINGELLDPDREYRVGTADMFTFGIGYLSLKEGREPYYYLPEFLRDLLVGELNDAEALKLSRIPRFRDLQVVT